MKQSKIGWLVLGLVGSLLVATTASAQTAAAPVTRQVTGEVLKVDGFNLVVKMNPNGEVRTFNAQPGRTAIVDGKTVTLDKVAPGTVLTATVTWVPAPGTATTVTGEVLFVSPPFVSVRLADNSVKQYTAKDDFEFMVNGRKSTIKDLRPDMKLTAVRLTEDPATRITPESPITGVGPKKRDSSSEGVGPRPLPTAPLRATLNPPSRTPATLYRTLAHTRVTDG